MVQSLDFEQSESLPEGERGLVTVLFADFVGYTSASELSNPEVMQEALNLALDGLGADIRRYGGYVDKIVGDQIMGLFGAPRAQEDDAGKAIAAGLAMQARMTELGPELERRLGKALRMRVGINTGIVVTGAVGGGGYTVTGDAVNVAARLESAAPHGGVMVGEATRRLSQRQYRWGERQVLAVKNRTEPVVCYTVEGAHTELLRLVPAPSDTPYIGRQALLNELTKMWESLSAGGRSVDLVGEAGVGKTRFLTHFLSTVGATVEEVLYSRADTPPRTFGPLLQLLPAVRDDLSPATRLRIESLVAQDDDSPHVERDWLVDALVEILTSLASTHPVALVLDDMHRADAATIDVVEKLLPRIASLPILTLRLRQPVGRRPKKLEHAASIVMEPLADEEAGALVAGAAPSLTPTAVSAIIGRAGGNPLYLEVLAFATAAAPAGTQVPESLQTAVVARIDELDETSRRVLREASVFGHAFLEEPLKLTTTVRDGFYAALDHLCEVGLLDEAMSGGPRGYHFRHSLVQEVLLEGLLRRRRAELHLRAAEALELVRGEGIDAEPEEIAYHFEQGGDAGRAASYHLSAAERADLLQAPAEARSHRRTANRLITLTSLGELYSQGRPSVAVRAGSAVLQGCIAALLLAPLFLLFAQRGPSASNQTLGLPTGIIGANPSSVLIAMALGGVPLFVSGLIFTHLAAPSLMRRHVSWPALALWSLVGWGLGLVSVLAGFGILLQLLRMSWLDRLSSMYVGGATLRLLLGDYSLLLSAVLGTLIAGIIWTGLLRFHARAWARARQALQSPRTAGESRRWVMVRQIGLLALIVGVGSIALITAYQLKVLPNSDLQTRLSATMFAAAIAVAGVFAAGGLTAWIVSDRRLRVNAVRHRFSLIGFEVPLLTAMVFGLVGWYGMRQAVIVSANDVDTPSDVAAYKRAAKLFPDLGVAHYLLGERYLSTGDLEASESELGRAIALDPGFPASYLPRGKVRIQLGNYDGAIADASKLIELRPEHPGGYAIRAWAEAEKGDTAGAAKDFELATRPLPPDAQSWDAYFVRCLTLAAVGQYERAKPDCLRVIELNPGHIVSLDQLAAIEAELGDYESSLAYTDRLLAVQPANTVALISRGSADRQLARYADAESDFTRAIDLDGRAESAYAQRAVVRVYLDRADDAMADAEQAVLLDPKNVQARLFVERYTGRHQRAIDDATTLIASTSSPTAFLFSSRGLSKLELGELQGGIDDNTHALEIDAEYAAGYDRRGYGYLLLGQLDLAQADLDQGLQRLTSLPPEGRAELYLHRARLSEARALHGRALEELREAAKSATIPGVKREIDGLIAELAPAQ